MDTNLMPSCRYVVGEGQMSNCINLERYKGWRSIDQNGQEVASAGINGVHEYRETNMI
jgi:hypothetical protein